MSAIRLRGDRRESRKAHASPYARPASKKSGWSLGGLLSYFNPLRLRSSSPSESSDDDASTASDPDISAAESLSKRGHQLAYDVSANGRPNTIAAIALENERGPPPLQSQPAPTFITPVTPTRLNNLPSLSQSSSPAKNLETVAAFLKEKGNQPMSEIEIEGLVSLINKSTPPEKTETFRFSSSTPSTPGREQSPNFAFGSPGPSGDSQTPRKVLTKNPNGKYRWEGGGSAKARNRYSSPAFGPSRSTPTKLKLTSPPEVPRTDTKRRRVGEEAESSTAQRAYVNWSSSPESPVRSSAPSPNRPADPYFPFPVSSGSPSPPVNSVSSPSAKVNGAPIPRIRTSALPLKATIPTIPSPLRQAWSQSESSSPPASISKPTKAANFMAELIKDVTPPQKPDVSNPYQTASPVKPATTKKTVTKRPRATGKPTAPPPPPKEVDISPQAIIEATLPKGSKRSRPPATFSKPASNGDALPQLSSTSSPLASPKQLPSEFLNDEPKGENYSNGIVEDAEDDKPIVKKQKKAAVNGYGHPSTSNKLQRPATIEEVDDVDMPLASKPQATEISRTPTEIIEVGEDSASETTSKPAIPSMTNSIFGGIPVPTSSQPTVSSKPLFKSSAPREPSKLRFSFQPVGTPPPTPPLQPVSVVIAPESKEQSAIDQSQPMSPKEAALAVAASDLPIFHFNVTTEAIEPKPEHREAWDAAKAASTSTLPVFDLTKAPEPILSTGFNWAAAGMVPMKEAGWTCKTCMLSNPASATDKCDICETPRS